MPHPILTYRCYSRSDIAEFHNIKVENSTVLCSCQGTDWCSHIDATLIHGEREMVPFEEWDIVDQAQALIGNAIRAPKGWKAHWRHDKRWRGQPTRKSAVQKAISAQKPTICFIGRGPMGSRRDYIEDATHFGWQPVEHPTRLVTLVVTDHLTADTRKAQIAESLNLPRISFETWQEQSSEITRAVFAEIGSLSRKSASS